MVDFVVSSKLSNESVFKPATHYLHGPTSLIVYVDSKCEKILRSLIEKKFLLFLFSATFIGGKRTR